jgi:DNA-binding transcriptional MerR regulator
MEDGYSTAEAARRIGVSRAVLLAWERRFGFPEPVRLLNGNRVYSRQLVSVLTMVPLRRDTGVPLDVALREARDHLETTEARPGSTPAAVFREVLDHLDVAVSILAGPDLIIEAANVVHQQMYPGQSLVGRPALDALTHSKFYDLPSVVRHVASTGNTLTWHETLVPHFGEDRWWNFSYSRLKVDPDEPMRLLMLARNVTADVEARREVESRIAQAAEVAARTTKTAAAFEILARLCERVAEGGGESDPELLGLVLQGLHANAVSSWTSAGGGWDRVVAVGGGHAHLPGHETTGALPDDNAAIQRAFESRTITVADAAALWHADHVGDAPRPVIVVPVRTEPSRTMILVESPADSDSPVNLRLLHSLVGLLRRDRLR